MEYSQSRLSSLQDEWQENYFGLGIVFKMFRGMKETLRVGDIDDDFLVRLLETEMDYPKALWLKRFLDQFVDQGDLALQSIRHQFISILYLVGFLGIKPSPQDNVKYSFLPSGQIISEDLTDSALLHIHPAFHRALAIRPT
jgi:hypothetical protein